MSNVKEVRLQIENIEQRLSESEQMLSRATLLADHAYLSLSEGDVEACQASIGQLIHSISEHFYEEVH